ncbi:hypothetical protein SESBI_15980 [Sesbania bispinosa]|nr:hypothetical protein SESBI_15980 [Sesbania bispinosa]
MVWIRIPGLPMEYHERSLLRRIGNTLGKTIRVDSNTLKPKDGYWGQTTRMSSEVDLRKVSITRRIRGWIREDTKGIKGVWGTIAGANLGAANHEVLGGSRFNALLENM